MIKEIHLKNEKNIALRNLEIKASSLNVPHPRPGGSWDDPGGDRVGGGGW